ncbi:Hypothetical predicted protein [Podarcis lilfordi]|uniref:Uncharacterized protein n=1 Tax=Podarcis lilfordi TaxID=74358 RepID=A0AA35L3M9_9SAUR|nr:Hypothetical predicted protein [Podarcis lilfordi]
MTGTNKSPGKPPTGYSGRSINTEQLYLLLSRSNIKVKLKKCSLLRQANHLFSKDVKTCTTHTKLLEINQGFNRCMIQVEM